MREWFKVKSLSETGESSLNTFKNSNQTGNFPINCLFFKMLPRVCISIFRLIFLKALKIRAFTANAKKLQPGVGVLGPH